VNYLHLTSALSSRFQPENQAEMYRAQMKNKLRGKNEPIPELGQDVKRLVRLAYPSAPTEVREQLARDCFVDSLNEAELDWAIFQGKTKTIDDAVQIALEYEAFQNGRRKRGLIKPVRMQTEVETDYEISSSRNPYLSGQIDDIAGRLVMIEKNDSTNKRSPLSVTTVEFRDTLRDFALNSSPPYHYQIINDQWGLRVWRSKLQILWETVIS